MMKQRTVCLVLLTAAAACDRTMEPAAVPPNINGWACEDYRGEAAIPFVAGGRAIVAVSVETGQLLELGPVRTDVRSLAIAGRTVYWADEAGIHSYEPAARKARDLLMSPDVDTIATDGGRLVYSTGLELMVLELPGGTPRSIAHLTDRYSNRQRIVVTPHAIYWGNVHALTNVKLPEQDTLWRVALETGARPIRIASLDILSGFCVGPGGRVVWLDGGPSPGLPAGKSDPNRLTRLKHAGGLLAEVRARPGGSLIATETGFAFTTVGEDGRQLSAWHATLEGALVQIPVSLPRGDSLLRVEHGTAVVERDGKIHRVPIPR